MNPVNNNGNEPPPDDEDRSLLFGSPKEGPDPASDGNGRRRARASASTPPPGSSPPAADAGAEPPDPAGRTGAVASAEAATEVASAEAATEVASSDAVQRRILALLESLEERAARPASGETDLAAAARTIAGQAEQIGAATEWVNDIKAAVSEILASTGKQIDGLKSGRQDLDAALAQLKILQERLDKVVQSLDATAKGLDKRSSELGAVKQELAGYYREWTAEAKTSLGEMRALSKRLDDGDHMVSRLERSIGPWTERIEQSIGASVEAQNDAAVNTAGNVKQLATTGSQFLRDFAATRGAALREARQEWTRIRRWTVPALAIALVLAAPLFVFAGALGQSELGVFERYDDTGGWKEAVWDRFGGQVRGCMLKSWRSGEVVTCSFNVRHP